MPPSNSDGFREDTKPLLRPAQIDDMLDEKRRLESMLEAPPHIRGLIQDRSSLAKQLRKLTLQLETQTPTPYKSDQLDDAVAREAELRDQITSGMPTQAEMRRKPPGAVDKHLAYEKRNKSAILEWKNIRLRLQAGGHLPDGEFGRDVANHERFRPLGGFGELSMDNAAIPGKQYYMPVGEIEIRNAMSNEDRVARGLPVDDSQPGPSAGDEQVVIE